VHGDAVARVSETPGNGGTDTARRTGDENGPHGVGTFDEIMAQR
jgi:hypothetical protein